MLALYRVLDVVAHEQHLVEAVQLLLLASCVVFSVSLQRLVNLTEGKDLLDSLLADQAIDDGTVVGLLLLTARLDEVSPLELGQSLLPWRQEMLVQQLGESHSLEQVDRI